MSECHTGVWYLHRKMELYSCFQRPLRYWFLTTRHSITRIRDTTVRNILPLKYDRISLNVRCLGSAKLSSLSTLHKPNIGPDVSRITTDRNSQSLNWKQQIAPYRKCSSSRPDQSSTILSGNVDRFEGLRINIQEQLSNNEALLNSKEVLKRSLLETISQCKADQQRAIWLEVPAQFGHVISIAAEAGFTFHHAEGRQAVMYQWLGAGENKIPDYATHQIGVSGFVLDEDSGKVLMIQDKHRIARWKFPGGYSKLGEDFSETAIREVFEETGVRAEFQSILAFRQQHDMPYSFDRSDIYVVCRLKPVTFDLTICSEELLDARWMHINELLTSKEHTPLSKHVANLAKKGLRESFDDVDITISELPSVYKGKTFKLFCRPH